MKPIVAIVAVALLVTAGAGLATPEKNKAVCATVTVESVSAKAAAITSTAFVVSTRESDAHRGPLGIARDALRTGITVSKAIAGAVDVVMTTMLRTIVRTADGLA